LEHAGARCWYLAKFEVTTFTRLSTVHYIVDSCGVSNNAFSDCFPHFELNYPLIHALFRVQISTLQKLAGPIRRSHSPRSDRAVTWLRFYDTSFIRVGTRPRFHRSNFTAKRKDAIESCYNEHFLPSHNYVGARTMADFL
jgi:hypothetical protein